MSLKSFIDVSDIQDDRLATRHKATMWAIASFSDALGISYPAMETIAQTSCSSRSTVLRSIQDLREWGMLATFPKSKGRGLIYVFTIDKSLENLTGIVDKFRAKFRIHIEVVSGNKVNCLKYIGEIEEEVQPQEQALPVEESDDWLKHTRIVKVGGEEEAKPQEEAQGEKDALTYLYKASQKKTEDWATPVQAGGATEYALGPVDAFARFVRVNALPDDKRAEWGKWFHEFAGMWQISPSELEMVIDGMIDNKTFNWRTFTSPFQKSWKENLELAIMQSDAPHGQEINKPKVHKIG